MRTLFHLWLSPFCRKVRVVLHEKDLDFDMRVEKVWERREDFLKLNPAGEVPVLVEPDGTVLSGSGAICEFLDETYPNETMLGADAVSRAETRRLIAWFDDKFHHEVTRYVLEEKFMKRFMAMGSPDSQTIRAGLANLRYHLDYIAYLAERRNWLAGENFSLADIAAGAHLSAIDYLGDMPWEAHPGAKEWYARLKSRPSFRPLLEDYIPGLAPPKHYADLDF
jgi:glutathione S-transferase